MLEFRISKLKPPKKRRYEGKKHLRKKIDKLGGEKEAYKAVKSNLNTFPNNSIYHIEKQLIKFLHKNVSRPVDKVFSEFNERSSKYKYLFNARKMFYEYIFLKEDINKRRGGFYVTNGILNYKEPIKKEEVIIKCKFNNINVVEYNQSVMPLKNKVMDLCEKASLQKSPQFLGKFYIGDAYKHELKKVYIIDKNDLNTIYNIANLRGYGIGLRLFDTYSQSKLRNKDIMYIYSFLNTHNLITKHNSQYVFITF